MPRFTTQTALATVLGLMVAFPAAAQDTAADCPTAAFDSDTDRNGMISEAEARSAAEEEFRRFDRDKDDKVSRQEFIDCFAMSALDMKDAEVAASGQAAGAIHRNEQNFAEADRNADGKVDRAEFALGAQESFDMSATSSPGLPADAARDENAAVPEGQTTGEADEVTAPESEEALADEQPEISDPLPTADASGEPATGGTDGDAEMSASGEATGGAELESGLAGVETGEPSETGAAGEMTEPGEPDAGASQMAHDRFLQSPYAEFPTMGYQEPTAEEMAFHTARLFFTLDANRDQALDTEEWTAATPAPGEQSAALGEIFDRLDGDGDGNLMLTEYVEAMVDAHVEAKKASAEAGMGGAMTSESGINGESLDGTSEQVTTGRTEMPEGEQATARASDADGVPLFLYRIYRF